MTEMRVLRRAKEVRLKFFSVVVLIAVSSQLPAQEKGEGQPVVNESKILVGQLWEFSDPETQKAVLGPLYKALREIEVQQGGLGLEQSPRKQDPNLMSMLQNGDVRKEIGMEVYQFEELQTRAKELRQSMVEDVREALSGQRREPAQLVEMVGRGKDRYDRELRKSVLPHQIERLRQVGFQRLIRERDIAQVITADPFRSELDLDEDDVEKIREKGLELRQEFERKVAELRKETFEKLLDELDEDQQKTVKDMLGEEMSWTRKTPTELPKRTNKKASK